MFDVVGLGACGIDYSAMVENFLLGEGKVISHEFAAGGGGVTANNVVQCARLGLKSAWCGTLGNDFVGGLLHEQLEKDCVEVFAHRTGQSQVCWMNVNKKGERQAYVCANCTRELTADIVNKFKNLISNTRHFHTEVAVIPLSVALTGAKIAKSAKVKVLIDVDGNISELLKNNLATKEELDELLELSDVIKFSESAAASLIEENKNAIENLVNSSELVIITKGEEGCTIHTKSKVIDCPAISVITKDTTGAGDAFMGGLSYGLLKGFPIEDIGRFANACGALCTTQIGARSSPNLKDLKEFLATHL